MRLVVVAVATREQLRRAIVDRVTPLRFPGGDTLVDYWFRPTHRIEAPCWWIAPDAPPSDDFQQAWGSSLNQYRFVITVAAPEADEEKAQHYLDVIAGSSGPIVGVINSGDFDDDLERLTQGTARATTGGDYGSTRTAIGLYFTEEIRVVCWAN